MSENTSEPADNKCAKLSLSIPPGMAKFVDEQCAAFGVGRSAYFQLLLEAEQHAPRREFVMKARS